MSASTQQVQVIETGLLSVKERAEAIVVRNAQDYIAVCNIVVEGRGFIKRWEEVFAPGIRSAKEHLALLTNQKNEKVEGARQIVAIAEQKAETYKRQEREAAQREQDEINRKARLAQEAENKRLADEARKKHKPIPEPVAAPVQTAVVAPNVPKVAGIKQRLNWKFRVVDASAVPRQFLTPDLVAIGQYVRGVASDLKGKTENEIKAAAKVAGVEVYCEDSI